MGAWIEKFIELKTSPRTGINASKNRPYSYDTLDSYKSYFKLHIKDDPISSLKMVEVEEEDILEFITRLSVIKKLWEENGKHEFVFCQKDGKAIGQSWIKGRFPKWLKSAGIELGGRQIVPHSSRHSLASLLEERGCFLAGIYRNYLGIRI